VSDLFFKQHLAKVPTIAILRGLSPELTVQIATRCWDAGIELVEVPAQGAGGLRALEAAAEAAKDRGTFAGAGTVYTIPEARRATEAGAAFLVAPGLDEETVNHASSEGVPYLPGVTTPSEVQRALALGVRTAKFFPAAPLGPEWVSALRGPFPEMSLVAVGGVTPHNAPQFIRAGALGVGASGAFSDDSAIQGFAALQPRSTVTIQANRTGVDDD
jgi:2-dehydro-3-deoxyphosphogluconate aldolase/(4S)-4-hydroxy-2-oxoglutarate aldolase